MATADKLTYLATTKTLLHDAIEVAGLPIPAGTPFREYPDYLATALSITVLIDFLGGIPASAAFSRASTKIHEQPGGSFVELPAEMPDYVGMRFGRNILDSVITPQGDNGGVAPVLVNANYGTITTADGDIVTLQRWTFSVVGTSSADRSRLRLGSSTSFLMNDHYVGRCYISTLVGVKGVTLYAVAGWNNESITVTDAPQQFSIAATAGASATGTMMEVRVAGDTSPNESFDLIIGAQCISEVPTAITTPPSYIPTDFNEYGVAGCNYFATENGNTVDVNGVVTEGVGSALPGPFKLQLDSADGGTLADGLSVDLSAYTDEQIESAKIKYYDGSDNLIVTDIFTTYPSVTIPEVTYNDTTKILAFNTPLSLAAANPIVLL